MKLKYKRILLLFGICIMGITMVKISIEGQIRKDEAKPDKVKITSKNIDQEVKEKDDNNVIEPKGENTIINGDNESSIGSILEKNTNKDINKLMKEYYAAKLKNKVKYFKPLVNSTDYINIKDNGRRMKYIESYQNITCYTRKNLNDDTYVVYVYQETKFKDIETVAPGLDRFYVMLGDNNKPYIFLGDVNKNTKQFIKETDESEEVLNLVSKVNEKYEQAVNRDGKLNEFKMKLEEPLG